jgi:hypothetical protein
MTPRAKQEVLQVLAKQKKEREGSMRIKRMVLAALTATGITTAMIVAAVIPAQAAPASPPTLCGCGDKSPFSVGTDAAGNDYVFYGGSDGGLWEKWSSGSTWYGPSEILKPPIGDAAGDGNVSTTTAVAVHPNGQQDVFWQGENNQDLYELSYVPGSGWGKLQNLGGPGPNNYNFDGLTVGVDGNGNDYLFWNNDGALWEKWHVGGSWYGPAAIYTPPPSGFLGFAPPSAIQTGPTVAVHPNGTQDVFWMGYNAQTLIANIWEDSYANGAWSGAKSLGVTTTVPADTEWPAAGGDQNNNDYIYWQDPNGGLREVWHIGSTWYGGNTGQQLLNVNQYGNSQGPSVAVRANGTQDVFWYEESSTTPVLMEYSYSDGAWHGPTSRGGF